MLMQPSFLRLILLLILGINASAGAQDTLQYQVGTLSGAATQDYLPHWITANRFGILDNNEARVSLLRAQAKMTHRFTPRWSVTAGVDAIAKVSNQPNEVFLQQGYLKIRYGAFELSGGRVEETLGLPDPTLSSGALGVSGNARPVPSVRLAVPEFANVPFTRGYLQIKGTYVHGWLGPDRYVTDPYLHEKSFYGKLGGKLPVNLYAGVAHFVIWGGEVDGQQIPDKFKDYVRVVTGTSALPGGADDPFIGEALNGAGDHLGVYDLGVSVALKPLTMQVYHQTLFEDRSGNGILRNRDRLVGISVKSTKKKALVSKVLYEFLYTKYQSGPGLTDPDGGDGTDLTPNYGYRYGGRDNYYNNYLYKTGWTYQDRIIGTPLFFTKSRTRLYIPGFVEPDQGNFNFNVVNNRVVAHHIGVEGFLGQAQYKLLSTFTQNYGTYGGLNNGIQYWGSIENPDAEYAFKPAQRQAYFLLEVASHPFSQQWSLLTSVAWDVGQLTNNVGILIGLRREGILTLGRSKE